MNSSRTVMLHGAENPPPARVRLRAGPLDLVYEAGDLRYIRLGPHEVVRRIYAAVRDHNWGTVPAELSDERIEAGANTFTIRYTATHRRGSVHFRWSCRMSGAADGTIVVAVDGVAEATFRRNRIGLCVLHPDTCAGTVVRVEHGDGTSEATTFPEAIAPHQPFLDLRTLAHDVTSGCWAELHFEGDIFEMEDQRNWSDSSFKTYSTPLSLSFPVEVAAGDRVAQRVTLRLLGALPPRIAADDGSSHPVTLAVNPAEQWPLPAVGLGLASDSPPLEAHDLARLRVLRPTHLRVELNLGADGWRALLHRAATESAALGTSLELALLLGNAGAELPALAAEVAELRPSVARWLIFSRGQPVSESAQVCAAREALGPLTPGALFGGGTLASFTELNRGRPEAACLEVVAYALNPQVHAFDLSSLAENLSAQLATVASVRRLYPGLPVAVSPVTLRPRFNPAATGPDEGFASEELPPQVDPRQLSLFGAGWTVGSIRRLTEGGAAALTYYETVGWRGVLERAAGSPLPARFPSTPGAVFPLYHVLAAVAEFAGGAVLAAQPTDPLRVEALALRLGARWCLIAANLTPEPQTVQLAGLSREASVRLLDAETAPTVCAEPERFRALPGSPLIVRAGSGALELPPFAVAFVNGGEPA